MTLQDAKQYLTVRAGLALLGLGVVSLLIYVRCGRKPNNEIPGQAVQVKVPVLLAQPRSAHKNIAKPVEKYVPPEGSVTITPKDPTKTIEEVVNVHYKEVGFVFEPGIEFSGNIYYSYGVDAKLFYAYRLGLGVGVVGGPNVTTVLSPDVFLSYRCFTSYFRNTEAIVTFVPASKIPVGVGIRISL